MTTDAAAPPTSVPTGPKPLLMEDIYRTIGALYLQIDLLQRQNQHLREQLAARGVTED